MDFNSTIGGMFKSFPVWISDEEYGCKSIPNKKSIFTNAYNGVPETLILNIISWIVLIILFTTLRHQAGDYGRLALVNSNGNKRRWTEVFYTPGKSVESVASASASASSSHTPQPSTSNQANNMLQQDDLQRSSLQEEALPNSTHNDRGIFSWIKITFKLQKEHIYIHTGPDAVHYLSFQQHLMIVMFIVTIVSLGIILPINFLNERTDSPYDENAFGRTTMANLSPDSAWMWVHVVVTIAYVPLIVLIMRRSSGRNAFKKAPTRTIMITNISQSDRNRNVIRNYIQELFPDVSIEDVQVAYNISKLFVRCAEYEKVLEARLFCEQHRDRDAIQVRPEFCSCAKESAYDYYLREEQILAGDVARLRAAALNEPLGIAFITVSSVVEAQNIVSHFTPRTYRQWNLSFAPSPDDIFWENLDVSKSHWYLKWATVNTVLFIVIFFLTTPAIIVNLLDSWAFLKDEEASVNPLISEFLPTLMLWTLSALMPVIVAFSDKWLAHYTKSLQNYSIMTKCFGYLLLMILILPSLGLTSAQALLEWSVSNDTMRWQCIFLPDRGSFYVNYIITASFIGTSLELLRFPELVVYMWMLLTAKSRAETTHIRKSILIEFPFGTQYAWTILVFTISIVYSVFCPLIMPFAMVYICLKHFVDRHNLYFAYGPSNMISRSGGKIHSTAVTMTKFSVIILLLIMTMISIVRGSGMARAIILIITLIVTLTLFTFMSPIKRCTSARRPSIVEIGEPAPIYIADVLKKSTPIVSGAINGGSGSGGQRHNSSNGYGYGSDSVSDFDISSQCSVNSVDA